MELVADKVERIKKQKYSVTNQNAELRRVKYWGKRDDGTFVEKGRLNDLALSESAEDTSNVWIKEDMVCHGAYDDDHDRGAPSHPYRQPIPLCNPDVHISLSSSLSLTRDQSPICGGIHSHPVPSLWSISLTPGTLGWNYSQKLISAGLWWSSNRSNADDCWQC